MATSPLTGAISAPVREKLYLVYTLVGLVIGAIQVAYAATDGTPQPDWLTIALAVYAYVGIALGATAASNTNPTPPPNAGL